METHYVCFVDDTPLTAEQLQDEITPPKNVQQDDVTPANKHLMIGKGSKMALYAFYATGPLLVAVDLLDTLLQRLTHRVCALLWQHWRLFGRDGKYTIEDLVIKVKSLCGRAEAAADGDIRHVSYHSLVRALKGKVKVKEDEMEAYFSEDEDSCDEEGSQEDVEGLDLRKLMKQYGEAKQEVQNGCTLDLITISWLDSLLQLSECGLLITSLQSPLNDSLMSTSTLRSQLMAFVKFKGQTLRVEAAHLFGSLLSRDFLVEMSHATQLEEDVGLNGGKLNGSPNFLLPWQPSNTLTMEQPLYAPRAFNCSLSMLEDCEAILDDIWEDQKRSLRPLQEDVSRAPALLIIAVRFWQKQVTALKQKRKEKLEKAKSRKKPRLHE